MRIIRLKEVMHKTGLARSTVYKYMAEKRFPVSVQLGEGSVGWVESEVDDWIEMLISKRG
ncbi:MULTISPECIES: AlpA family transcriptional regulator [Halopseudomonas]|uniref:Transcriptional regulator, AlpA family n=2 Tax=Halopseudomonas TaxID=2901189 RepID=A0A1H9NBX3_9GAMM|nr:MULTISPECIES: AlpA family transcriptional regulator [Halopseudomonas]SER33388.1 transcriptional regulator, AlpA family [Halopseudomonas bauzanensis]SFL82298.1 transcriptional regulator, AlpA family [Halopseudomonas bauzanensis]SFQ85809.1 transcriptional regulator, AlpA family [Halopseudomonas formosensis]